MRETASARYCLTSLVIILARITGAVLISAAFSACGRIPSTPIPAPRVWFLTSATLAADRATAESTVTGGLILLDSTTFRPVLRQRGAGVTTFTSYQGSRYHPDAVKAIAEEPAVLDTFSRSVASVARSAGTGLLLDFQDLSASDLPRFVELVRSIASAAHAQSLSPFGIIIPAGDTLAYPASVLARVADVIVVRLGTEHRPGTPAGPLTSPDFIRRHLGTRAIGLGSTRLAAEFPLYGYIWARDGSARRISHREASEMIRREAGVFRRDPTSQFLTAEGRDGWTIWVPDARTISALIAIAQSRGVNTIALTGVAGADPAIRDALAQTMRRSF